MTIWIVIILLAHGAKPDAAPPQEAPATSGNYVARLPNGTTIYEFPEVPDAAYRVVETASGNKIYGIILDPNQNPFVLQQEMVESPNGALSFDTTRASFRWEDCKKIPEGEDKGARKERRDKFVQQQGFEKLPADGHARADRNTWVPKDEFALAQDARELARKEQKSEGEPLATALFAPLDSGPMSETKPAGQAAIPSQDSPRFLALWGWHMLILAVAVALVGLLAYTTLLRH